MKRFAVLGAVVVALFCIEVHAAVPQEINFQGRLTDTGGTPIDGAVNMTFRLYDAESGGSEEWSEASSITATDGYVSAVLGETTPITPAILSGGTLWLEVNIEAEVLMPRFKVAAAPYAILADTAEALGSIVESDVTTLQTQVGTNTTDIATNATDITTNTTAIAANATDIATNTTNIATNTTDIATNTTDITGKADTSHNHFGEVWDANGLYGLRVNNNAAAGATYGLFGYSEGTTGYGVVGYANASTDVNYGVYGNTQSASGYGVYSSGRLGVGGNIECVGGDITTNQQLISTVATGTAPLSVASTTTVTNLNADLLDGQHESAFFRLNQNETVTGRPIFNGGVSGVTPPFYVNSTTLVDNLNADMLDGQEASAFSTTSHTHYSLDASDGSPTNAVYVDADGEVGIGTVTPSANLHVYAVDTAVAEARICGLNQGTGILYVGQSPTIGGGIAYSGDDIPDLPFTQDHVSLFRRSAGTDYEVMHWSYSSNTVTTTGSLDIAGAATTGGNLSVGGAASTTGNLSVGVDLTVGDDVTITDDLSVGGFAGIGGPFAVWDGSITGANGEYILLGETNNVISFFSGLTERIRIHSNGCVGISTNAPADTLDVNGDIRVRGADIKDAGGTSRITLTDNGSLILKEDGGANALVVDTDGNVEVAGSMALNNTIDANSKLYVERPSSDYGADKAGIYSYRSSLDGAANGGTAWGLGDVDCAIKGYSYWGNSYTAAIAGYSYLDEIESAAVIGAYDGGSSRGILAYRDGSGTLWSGYFDANVYVGGTVTEGSSRELKENIKDLTTDEAVKTLKALEPIKYNYKADEKKDLCLGFIAEDVPELVSVPDRKGLRSMDVVAVLTKVVQEQQKTIEELKQRIEDLEK